MQGDGADSDTVLTDQNISALVDSTQIYNKHGFVTKQLQGRLYQEDSVDY